MRMDFFSFLLFLNFVFIQFVFWLGVKHQVIIIISFCYKFTNAPMHHKSQLITHRQLQGIKHTHTHTHTQTNTHTHTHTHTHRHTHTHTHTHPHTPTHTESHTHTHTHTQHWYTSCFSLKWLRRTIQTWSETDHVSADQRTDFNLYIPNTACYIYYNGWSASAGLWASTVWTEGKARGQKGWQLSTSKVEYMYQPSPCFC